LSFYSYFRDAAGLTEATGKLAGLLQLAEQCGWWWPFQNVVILTERHNILHFDDRIRLHCEDGPALSYPDGWSIYAIHGVRVPEDVVMQPEALTVERIESEQNAEIRRVMIDRYGQVRYLQDSGAKEIHRDDWGILYHKDIPDDEPMVMVKVVNSTPEPDGAFKDYFLRVPPHIDTALDAVAWTFGKSPSEYAALSVQT
jgi:hypothetical protein